MDEKNPCETRSSFHIPSAKEVSLGKAEREEAIYLCGNSLGNYFVFLQALFVFYNN